MGGEREAHSMCGEESGSLTGGNGCTVTTQTTLHKWLLITEGSRKELMC